LGFPEFFIFIFLFQFQHHILLKEAMPKHIPLQGSRCLLTIQVIEFLLLLIHSCTMCQRYNHRYLCHGIVISEKLCAGDLMTQKPLSPQDPQIAFRELAQLER